MRENGEKSFLVVRGTGVQSTRCSGIGQGNNNNDARSIVKLQLSGWKKWAVKNYARERRLHQTVYSAVAVVAEAVSRIHQTRCIIGTHARNKKNVAWHLPDRFTTVAAEEGNENVFLSSGRSIDSLIVSLVCTHASRCRFGGPGSVRLHLTARLPTIPNPRPPPTSRSRFSCRSGRSVDPW